MLGEARPGQLAGGGEALGLRNKVGQEYVFSVKHYGSAIRLVSARAAAQAGSRTLSRLTGHLDAHRRLRDVVYRPLARAASLRPGEQLSRWVSFVSSAQTVGLSVQRQLAVGKARIHARLLCPVLPISGHSCHRQSVETKWSRDRSPSINGQRRRNKRG